MLYAAFKTIRRNDDDIFLTIALSPVGLDFVAKLKRMTARSDRIGGATL